MIHFMNLIYGLKTRYAGPSLLYFNCPFNERSTEFKQFEAICEAKSQLASVAEQVAVILPKPALSVPVTVMVHE